MPLPALLVVFVLSPGPAEPTAPYFQSAAHEVLGPSAAVRVQHLAEPLSDAAALDRARGADGIVELSWDASRAAALLHCYIASQAHWVERTIHFGAADHSAERDRLLGFAVASMFMDAPTFSRTGEQQAVQTEPEASPVAAPPSVPPAPRIPSRPPSQAALDVPEKEAPTQRQAPSMALELGGVAAGGSRRASPELGALVALRVPVSQPLALRLQLSARGGQIPDTQARVRRLLAGFGVVWNALPEAQPWGLELRADALGSAFQVEQLANADPEPRHEGWLFGGDAVARLAYRFSALATAYAGAGFEAMLGRTPLYARGVEVATEQNLRGLGEIGLRAQF
jgi:hypothetical protein